MEVLGTVDRFTFRFFTEQKNEFSLLVANPLYWPKVKLEDQKQVFYLLIIDNKGNQKFVKIPIESKEEKILVQLLKNALDKLEDVKKSDSTMLKRVIDHLKNREPFPEFLTEDQRSVLRKSKSEKE